MDDRHMIPLIVFGSLLVIMFSFIVVSFLIIHRQRLRQHKAELKEKEYQFSNVLLKARIEMQEHAMKIMSQEVHDNINQVMGITKLLWEEAIPRLQPEEVKSLIRQSADRLGNTINDLRNMSHLFNGQMISELGLEEAIRKELSHLQSVHHLNWTFECPFECPALGAERELLIFRIMQEAVYNIVQHARARLVTVTLTYFASRLVLVIQDDGQGFQLEQMGRTKGLGLVNMRERADCLNGKLEFESEPGRGTSVTLTVFTKKQK
jgi:two-component system NarL family sensor kinase